LIVSSVTEKACQFNVKGRWPAIMRPGLRNNKSKRVPELALAAKRDAITTVPILLARGGSPMSRTFWRHAVACGVALLVVCATPLAQETGGAAAPSSAPTVPAAVPLQIPPVQTPTITNNPAQGTPMAPSGTPTVTPEMIRQIERAGGKPPAVEPSRETAKPPTGEPSKPSAEAPARVETTETNEFQEFIGQSTGRRLPLFGYNLFRDMPTTFAPVDNIPVTPDYVMGPGDELLIRAWGQIDVDFRAIVDRNGMVNIPRVGSVPVAGIPYKDITNHIRTAVSRNFRNFELMVTMGQLRSVQILVVGQARRPGTYTVSSLSTMVNAVFAAGGPSIRGSMRTIQLKRGSTVVTELDLYDLIALGDKSKDVPVLPGDVIYFPPVGPLVALSGSVNNPAIFELKGNTNLGKLIDVAGGLTTTAQTKLASIERIDERQRRTVDQVSLDYDGLRRAVKDGDLVSIFSVSPRFDNAVTIRGNVASPMRHPWRKGLRITHLLVDENALISGDYWERQNRGAMYKTPKRREVNFDYATVQRLDRNGLVTRLFAFNLGKAIQGDRREDLELEPGDVVSVYAYDDPLPRSENDVVLQGSVLGLPARRFPWREGMRFRDLIPSAQWLVEYYDYWARVRDPGSRTEINWDYASIERVEANDLTRSLLPLNLAKALLEGDAMQNVALRAGDEVTLFAKSELAGRQSRDTTLVRLEGEFHNAGVYQALPGETLRQLVTRVGGVTKQAYLFGAEFTRASTRRNQEQRLKQSLDQVEQDIQRAAVSRAQSAISAEDAATLKQETEAQRSLLTRLRTLRPTGRIVLELPEHATPADLPEIALEDGDRFYIPAEPNMVSVFGTVFNESSFLHHPDKRVSDYLAQAGGPRKEADKRSIYLLRADGSVVSAQQSSFLLSSINSVRVMPGDALIVPEDFTRTTLTKDLKDWTQILYQFGLGAAAIKVISRP
jgi:polysaccharide biosynthesis/export protein